MPQTSINIKADDILKRQFDALCSQLGLSLQAAITIFMKNSVRNRRIPLSLALDTSVAQPKSLSDFSEEELNESLEQSLMDYEAGLGRPANEVFDDLEGRYCI